MDNDKVSEPRCSTTKCRVTAVALSTTTVLFHPVALQSVVERLLLCDDYSSVPPCSTTKCRVTAVALSTTTVLFHPVALQSVVERLLLCDDYSYHRRVCRVLCTGRTAVSDADFADIVFVG